MEITILGAGYAGLTTGLALSSLGHKVICIDKDELKIEKLKKGIIPIHEPGLEEFLNKYRDNIKFETDISSYVKKSNAIFICVGTPSNKNGRIDLTYYKEAIIEIAKNIDNYKVIVNKSTVPVSTAEWAKEEIKKYYKRDFSIVSNPEFLREGSALKDFLEPDRIVIGVEDKRSEEIMLEIYSKIKAPKIITDIRSAEMIKYAANAFLAMKISFINEVANICEQVGADVKKVAEGIGMDKRIGPYFLSAGIGYGGSCFPKDILALLMVANDYNYDCKLLKAVAEVNEYQQKRFVGKIREVLTESNGDTVAVWGLAFKPNTDDVRKSQALKIVNGLLEEGYIVRVYDPKAMENAKREIGKLDNKCLQNVCYCNDPYECVEDADALALVTEWDEFKTIDFKRIKNLMRQPYILDGRNFLEPEEIMKLGFLYEGVGRKFRYK